MVLVKSLNKNDVRVGGGNPKHPGNIRYINLIETYKKKFVIAKVNRDCNKKDSIIKLVHKAFSTVNADFCAKVVQHCMEVMDKAMEAEKLIDLKVRPVIISSADQVNFHF